MPNLPNGSKGGFEPGLTRLRFGILPLSYHAPHSSHRLLSSRSLRLKPSPNSFSTWLSSVMPLYFPGSCAPPLLSRTGTIRPTLHSFGILPSCIHMFSSLPVHLTPTSPAISITASCTSSAPVAFPFSSWHCCFHFFLSYLLHAPLSPNRARELGATCCSFSVQ